MFNQKKFVSLDEELQQLSKPERVNLIGKISEQGMITDIEPNGQVRAIRDERKFDDVSEEDVNTWKQRYLDSSKHFHPGDLLDKSDSNETLNEVYQNENGQE